MSGLDDLSLSSLSGAETFRYSKFESEEYLVLLEASDNWLINSMATRMVVVAANERLSMIASVLFTLINQYESYVISLVYVSIVQYFKP